MRSCASWPLAGLVGLTVSKRICVERRIKGTLITCGCFLGVFAFGCIFVFHVGGVGLFVPSKNVASAKGFREAPQTAKTLANDLEYIQVKRERQQSRLTEDDVATLTWGCESDDDRQ